DLIEVADERTAVSEVHQFPLEFLHERLDLGDPLVSMPADAEQLPFRRQAEAFLDEEELVGPAGAALNELVHAAPRGVHQRRGRAVDQVARGEQVPTARRKRLAIEDPEDRPEDVVAPHVRRAVERIEDDGEAPPADLLHLPPRLPSPRSGPATPLFPRRRPTTDGRAGGRGPRAPGNSSLPASAHIPSAPRASSLGTHPSKSRGPRGTRMRRLGTRPRRALGTR